MTKCLNKIIGIQATQKDDEQFIAQTKDLTTIFNLVFNFLDSNLIRNHELYNFQKMVVLVSNLMVWENYFNSRSEIVDKFMISLQKDPSRMDPLNFYILFDSVMKSQLHNTPQNKVLLCKYLQNNIEWIPFANKFIISNLMTTNELYLPDVYHNIYKGILSFPKDIPFKAFSTIFLNFSQLNFFNKSEYLDFFVNYFQTKFLNTIDSEEAIGETQQKNLDFIESNKEVFIYCLYYSIATSFIFKKNLDPIFFDQFENELIKTKLSPQTLYYAYTYFCIRYIDSKPKHFN